MDNTQPRQIIDLEAYEFNLAVKMEVRKQLVEAVPHGEGSSSSFGNQQKAHQIMRSLGQWERSSAQDA